MTGSAALTRILGAARRATGLGRAAVAVRRLRRSQGATDRALARRALADVLGDLRGLPMKVGQLLSTDDPADPMRALVHGVAPRDLDALLPTLEAGLGRPWREVLRSIEPAGIAASLGQVHRGVLHDGREVAIKIRYPDIGDAVDHELSLAGLLPAAGPVRRYGFDRQGYLSVLRGDLLRELDYPGEAARQRDFAAGVRVEGLVVPDVHDTLCGEGALVQSWEAGERLAEVTAWPRKDRLQLALIHLQTLIRSLFVHGEVHGDPHPGNALYRRGPGGAPEVVLLDYGCTVPVGEVRALALLKLVLALREGEAVDHLAAWSALGFDPEKLVAIDDALPALGRLLLEPFLIDRPFDTRAWGLSERMRTVLGELRWWFRAAGPPDLLLLVRAFQGLVTVLERLDVSLPWWPVLARVVGPDLLDRARALALPRPVVSRPERTTSSARLLRVRLQEGDAVRHDLSFPASEITRLEALMPPEVAVRIRDRHDLRAIVEGALRKGLQPQELFTHAEGSRRYRVWLA